MAIVSSERPWNAWSNTTTADRPVWARAILTAFSTASAPVVNSAVRLACSPGVSSLSACATST